MSLSVRASLALLMGLSLTACQQDSRPRNEAETHWLDQCDANSDCGGGLCVCGVCTAACGADDICDAEARPACANVERLAQVCGAPIAACVRECAVEADCGAGDFECRDGVCVADGAPRPEPEPPVDACAAICDDLVECFSERCEDRLPPSIADDCRAGCGAVGAAEWGAEFATCDGAVDWVRANYTDVTLGCERGPEPEARCAAVCSDASECFAERCPGPLDDAVTADCLRTCAGAGPDRWEVVLQTCDDAFDWVRNNYPDVAAGCAPSPIDCNGFCLSATRCAPEWCDSMTAAGEIPGACLDACAEANAEQRARLIAPMQCDATMRLLFDMQPALEVSCSVCTGACAAVDACLQGACDGTGLNAVETEDCMRHCDRTWPPEFGQGNCEADLELTRRLWPETADACGLDEREPNPLCTAEIPVVTLDSQTPFDTSAAPEFGGADCVDEGRAQRFRLSLDTPNTVALRVDSNFDSALIVHPSCFAPSRVCQDGGVAESRDAAIELDLLAGDHEILVTGADGETGVGQLLVARVRPALLPACEAIDIVSAGNPGDAEGDVWGEIEELAPRVRSAIDGVRVDRDGLEVDELRARATVLTESQNGQGWGPARVDGLLSRLDHLQTALAPHLEASSSARELAGCVDVLARRMARVQMLYVAEVCGDAHPTARLLDRLSGPDAESPAQDVLCATRNAHDMCQSRYLDAEPLTEPGRCPSCAVRFGQTQCALTPADTCGRAGECLCAARGLEGDACEFTAFGPRGALAFGEACVAADDMLSALENGQFDGAQDGASASPGCALWPAVLDERQCEPADACRSCGDYVALPARGCQPGNDDCEVFFECGQRFVAVDAECFIIPGVCDSGEDAVAECADDQVCETEAVCGTSVTCQPERP